MKVVAIIQARLGSTRLPGKVLLPLLGRPMLEHLWERVSRATRIQQVLVAVPMADYNGLRAVYIPFLDWCPYDGQEADLVGRYLYAATLHRADVIVRVPGDNPCVDPAYVDQAVEYYENHPTLFYTNTTAYVRDRSVDGIGAEVLSVSRLRWLDQRTKGHAGWREHPHQYFVEALASVRQAASIRLDVNTPADYDFIRTIYEHFGHNRFTAEEVLTFLQGARAVAPPPDPHGHLMPP